MTRLHKVEFYLPEYPRPTLGRLAVVGVLVALFVRLKHANHIHEWKSVCDELGAVVCMGIVLAILWLVPWGIDILFWLTERPLDFSMITKNSFRLSELEPDSLDGPVDHDATETSACPNRKPKSR